MLDAITAEALKLRRHRATWLMVWIYPIIAFVLSVAFLIRYIGWGSGVAANAVHAGPAAHAAHVAQAMPASIWIEQSTFIWGAPLFVLSRYLIAGFCAVAFAGEYGWNTWKLIIPARARWQLILAKWVVVIAMLYAALLASDVIMLVFDAVYGPVGGPALPAGIGFGDLLYAHGTAMAEALVPMAYTVVCAGLLAVLTRSVLATVLLSIALITIEQMLPVIGMFLGGYAPGLLAALIRVLPFYHIGNVISFAQTARESTIMIGTTDSVSFAWQTSLAASIAWIAGLAGLTLYRFERQDLN